MEMTLEVVKIILRLVWLFCDLEGAFMFQWVVRPWVSG